MPLKPGSSQKTISSNIRELHEGQEYERTLMNHGKKVADKQAVAIAEKEARKTGRR